MTGWRARRATGAARAKSVSRAPCRGRGCHGAREGKKTETMRGARALTGQQALDEAEDLPDPLALSGDFVVIAHLPSAALPEQPERVGKRLREVGWRIRLAAARREPNLRRSHPRKGRVGAVVPAAAASRRSNLRSRESGTLLSTAFAIPRSIRARLEAAESSLTRPEVSSSSCAAPSRPKRLPLARGSPTATVMNPSANATSATQTQRLPSRRPKRRRRRRRLHPPAPDDSARDLQCLLGRSGHRRLLYRFGEYRLNCGWLMAGRTTRPG